MVSIPILEHTTAAKKLCTNKVGLVSALPEVKNLLDLTPLISGASWGPDNYRLLNTFDYAFKNFL